MPKLSAIVYARENDGLFLDKTLHSLQVAHDILLINADNSDEIKRIGRRFHARVKSGIAGVTPGAYLMDAYHPWILVLLPTEALSDELSQSLKEWKRQKEDDNPGYSFDVLEQNEGAWRSRAAELRLVDRRKINWTGDLPPNAEAPRMRGPLLRYEPRAREQKVA